MKRRNSYHNRTPMPANPRTSFFSWSHFAITILAALALAAGLFFAASQHFSSMELGIKNAKLRGQLADLENEKRRLELSREIALTPSELKKNARMLGFRKEGELVPVPADPRRTTDPTAIPVTTVTEMAKTEERKNPITAIKVASEAKPQKRDSPEYTEIRSRRVPPAVAERSARKDGVSRPRIVVASERTPKPDPQKLVKKTVMSRPTVNRSR